MDMYMNLIKISAKYNKKKIFLKKCNKTTKLCLYLLKLNLIKNFKNTDKIILITLNFYKNKPILKTTYNIKIKKNKNKIENKLYIQI